MIILELLLVSPPLHVPFVLLMELANFPGETRPPCETR